FYDRRRGHYKDQQEDITKIVSIITLVQAVVAILLGKPHDARGRPRDYVAKETKRFQVFGHDDYDKNSAPAKSQKPYELEVYLQCVRILRRVDEFIENPNQKLDAIEQRNLRFYLARYAACHLAGTTYCHPAQLLKTAKKAITDNELTKGLKTVQRIYKKQGGDDDAAKGPQMTVDLDRILLKRFPSLKKRAGKSA
ncbi:MAG: hypothetical protein ABR924_07845, partial [Terracidiphilus sp.]